MKSKIFYIKILLISFGTILRGYSQNLTKFISVPITPTLWMQGEYGVWYKTTCARSNETNRITRPFIICEGFDVQPIKKVIS
ncbi:MAG: hypothetical protein U0V72_04335 [Cytophagales bacterium]